MTVDEFLNRLEYSHSPQQAPTKIKTPFYALKFQNDRINGLLDYNYSSENKQDVVEQQNPGAPSIAKVDNGEDQPSKPIDQEFDEESSALNANGLGDEVYSKIPEKSIDTIIKGSSKDAMDAVNEVQHTPGKYNRNSRYVVETIKELYKYYQAEGFSPEEAKFAIRMAIVETGWFNNKLATVNNFASIIRTPRWKGDYIKGHDTGPNGKYNVDFRAYPSKRAFVKDHVDLLTRIYKWDRNDSWLTLAKKLRQKDNTGKGYNYSYADLTKTYVYGKFGNIDYGEK